jgi:hypothetical protein
MNRLGLPFHISYFALIKISGTAKFATELIFDEPMEETHKFGRLL